MPAFGYTLPLILIGLRLYVLADAHEEWEQSHRIKAGVWAAFGLVCIALGVIMALR